ncbi:MAG: response regulator transcription factor [Bacteroidota bacterium]
MITRPVILLVEDEENLLEAIKLNLELEGYKVITANNGKDGQSFALEIKTDLIILDVMLPFVNGFDICKNIREKGNTTPVLFLTAKGDSSDRVTGLKIGGDDYLVKPFNLEELLLRVSKLISRSQTPKTVAPDTFQFSVFTLNFLTFEAFEGTKKLADLTKRESLLLKLLIEKANQVVSREEILDRIWGEEAYPSSRTIDNYILLFRKYFEKDPKNPRFFHSIRGVGYKFTP